jgi:tetratricopeptide (TPR) repeat protein
MAHLKVSQEKFEEAVAHARAAARLDYENPVSAATVPWFILFAGRTEEALKEATRVVARFGPSPVAHMILGYAYCAAGMMKEAVDEYQQARKIEFLPDALASEGFVHGREGRSKEALGCLDTIRRAKAEGTIAYVSSYFEALIYWGLGEKKPALDALERAFEEKCDWLIYLAVEPRWKVLRDEKRFAGLLRRVGLKRTT